MRLTGGGRQPREALREAFEKIVREYHSKVYNYLYYMLGDREEAADLTQEVFVNAYAAFDRFRGDARVYTWLSRIARNLAINRGKRRRLEDKARALSLQDSREDAEAYTLPDGRPDPEAQVEAKETQEMVRLTLNAMPAALKDVIVLRDIQGFSYEEMSEILGCSLEAVKSRLFRSRALLRQRLEPLLGEGTDAS